MDDLDQKLIALLRDDARAPVSQLATALNVSRATVRARIDRLMASGAILGFTLRLGAEAGPAIRAIIMIAVEGRHAEPVIKALKGFPEILALHTTNGRWDIVAEARTSTLEAFDTLLRRVREVTGVSSTETSILLAARK